ncbi:hypothetical protein [Streptomyces sp. NBC_00887]|uniref:hypothetical protein n=1 Tax=Streptomyces sp. NBC_00887 TaxID=2975859 RepID=UPI003870B7A0|nr:hypothetical protein OG844_02825 [Streptomyces sp. NBC_00887]WSY35948.1 hypothetical protein OG844_42775 [Streptomyces sp. NBC_00887]
MHRTGPTDSSANEAPRTAAETRHTETSPASTETRHTETPRTAPETRHAPAPGTAAKRTATPGSDPTQVMNRGPGDAGAPPAARPSTASAPAGRPAGRPEATPAGMPLLPVKEQESLTERMKQAIADFVESPRQAVEEAESTFDRIVADLTEALEERRRSLRTSWQAEDTEARTEELRVALQQYRDVGERLLRV